MMGDSLPATLRAIGDFIQNEVLPLETQFLRRPFRESQPWSGVLGVVRIPPPFSHSTPVAIPTQDLTARSQFRSLSRAET